MYESLTEVLNTALERIQSGESVEECLARFPEFADELEPLLRLSASIQNDVQAPLPPELDAWLTEGAREFAAISAQALMPERSPRFAVPFLSVGRENTSALADILDEALSSVRTGETVDEVLAAYPAYTKQLTPLLHLSNTIQQDVVTDLPAELEAWLPTGAREFRAIAEQQLGRRRVLHPVPIMRSTAMRRAVASVVIGVMLLTVVDTTSNQSLPGEPLYTWKLAREDLTIALAPSPDARGWLHARYAQERIEEARALRNNGVSLDSPLFQGTLSGAVEHSESALSEAERANTVDEVLPVIDRIASESREVTEDSLTTTPVEVQDLQNKLDEIAERPSAIGARPTSTPTASVTAAPSGIGAGGNGAVGDAPSATPTLPMAQASRTPTVQPAVPTSIATGVGESPTPASAGVVVPSAIPTATESVEVDPPINPQPSVPSPTAGVEGDPPLPTLAPTLAPTLEVVQPTSGPTEEPLPPIPVLPPPVETLIPTEMPTLAPTLAPTLTPTLAPTSTTAPTNTLVPTETPTPSNTPSPTSTMAPTSTTAPTNTLVPTETPTPSNTPTSTPEPTETPTPSNTPTTTPTDAPTPTSEIAVLAISPVLECIVDLPDGQFVAHFGYENPNPFAVTIPIGEQNNVIPGDDDQGQPTRFARGRSAPYPNAAYTVTSTSSSRRVVWRLNGERAVANRDSERCPVPDGQGRATPTATDTSVPTVTDTPTPTATATDVPTATPTDTPTPTDTVTPTEQPTNTPTATEQPTNTPIPTDTVTPTEQPTNEPTATLTNTSIPTATPMPTAAKVNL